MLAYRLFFPLTFLAVWTFGGELPGLSFSRDVKPILQRSCAGCHKPGKLKGKLDVTSYEGLMKGGESGPVIVRGRVDESLLVQSVTGDPPEMPEKGETLTEAEIGVIRGWIELGATNDTGVERGPRLALPVYHALPAVATIGYGLDGTLAVGGHREVLLYDDNGDLTGRLMGQLSRIDSVAFSPDGKLLAVAASEPSVRGEIQLWDLASRALQAEIEISADSVFGLSFSPTGDRIAVGGADRILRVIDVPEGKEQIRFANHTDWVFGTGFSQDGQLIASGGRDGSVRVIEAQTGKFLSELAPNREPILALAVHPAVPQVVYGGEKGGVRVYKMDAKEGFKDPGDNKLHVRDYDHFGGAVYAVVYSRDGKWVAIGGQGAEVRIHQADNGQRTATLRGHRGAIYACAFDPRGERIATAGSDGLIRIYKVPSGELLQNFGSVPLSPRTSGRAR